MEHRTSWEAYDHSDSEEFTRLIWNKTHYSVQNNPISRPYPESDAPSPHPGSSLPKSHFNNNLPPMHMSQKWSFHWLSNHNFEYTSHVSLRSTCPAHLASLILIALIISCENKLWSTLLCNYLHPWLTSLPMLSSAFSSRNTPNLRSFIRETDQVSHS
jgi:hypothetical protein